MHDDEPIIDMANVTEELENNSTWFMVSTATEARCAEER